MLGLFICYILILFLRNKLGLVLIYNTMEVHREFVSLERRLRKSSADVPSLALHLSNANVRQGGQSKPYSSYTVKEIMCSRVIYAGYRLLVSSDRVCRYYIIMIQFLFYHLSLLIITVALVLMSMVQSSDMQMMPSETRSNNCYQNVYLVKDFGNQQM